MIKKAIVAVCCLLASLAPHHVSAANDKPFVIPELKVWKGGEGLLTFATADGQVASLKPCLVVKKDANSAKVLEVARLLASDLKKSLGVEAQLPQRNKAQAGDIYLEIKKDKALGDEGYTLSVTDRVTITAPTAKGLYWGTRTLLQMLDRSKGKSLPKGTVRDWPDYSYRGAFLDAGRKFLPMSMLRDYVRILSYYKMNALQIHLNDNGFKQFFDGSWGKTYAAFRMESDTYPGLAARDGYYTKREFIQLQELADSLGVDIIPEIDMPAHVLAFTHYKPEIGSKKYGMDHLDLFNPETYTFLDGLFKEYLDGPNPVFRGKYVHIGTDEYSNADPEVVEKFRALTDRYIRTVEGYGKKAKIWGSLTHAKGTTPVKVKDVLMDLWSNGYADPDSMVKLGYDVVSIPDGYVYIVPKAGYYYDYLNSQWLYEHWTPANVNGKQFPERLPQIKGGSFAVWNDIVGNGITDQDIHYRCMPAIRTMATKMWTASATKLPWADFERLAQDVREAPGINYAGYHPEGRLQVAEVKPGDKLALDNIGWNYEVSFDIDAQPEAKGTVLFTDGATTFYLADPVSGMMGYSRDGYLHHFNYQFYPGEKAHVAIRGDKEQTTLLVNGKAVETLGVKQLSFGQRGTMYYIRTLVFPLKQAGPFRSRVTNLSAQAVK